MINSDFKFPSGEIACNRLIAKYYFDISVSHPLLTRVLYIEPISVGSLTKFSDPCVQHWAYRLESESWSSDRQSKIFFECPDIFLKSKNFSLRVFDTDSNSSIVLISYS